MKDNRFNIFIHVLGWITFLSFPLLFSPKPPEALGPKFGNLYLLPIMAANLGLVAIFYLNYFIFIPRYLFYKRIGAYVGLILASILINITIPMFIMSFFHPPSDILFNDPILRDTIPLSFANSLLMFSVALTASIGLRFNDRWKKTENERISAQLAYLRTQINPHFLFNTLNSIYSVTIGKSPQGAEMIGKLAEIMRYTLKDTQLDYVSLEKEIMFIRHYIDLQKVRFDQSVPFQFKVEGDFTGKRIAPLLLIPFIENTFKHGVNAEQNSNINIKIEVKGNDLFLDTKNNKVTMQHDVTETNGLGIENTKNRLELMYPDKHRLSISETDQDFSVSLLIQLS
ncbi:MAG: histidine kinase [Bacteroidota bacterium]